MRKEAKLTIVALILFAVFVPIIPFSTLYPPPMITRNWHCIACPMMTRANGYTSMAYVMTSSNLGSIDALNHFYVGACLPFNVIRDPCVTFGMINPRL